jgi:hypothetical protein
MANSINQGYRGLLLLGGSKIRCSSFGMNVSQDFEAYNHVMGLNDFVLAPTATKFEIPGVIQKQKVIIRPKPFVISGAAAFPLTDGMDFPTIFEYIRTGEYLDELTFEYFCNDPEGAGGDTKSGRKFIDCRFDTLSISATAGDVVTISTNIFAKGIEEADASPTPYTTAEKLVTWEKVELTIDDTLIDASLIQGFQLDIKNNVQPVFTASPDNPINSLGPHDLRIGMQDVSGTLNVYGMDGVDFLADCGGGASPSDSSEIKLKIGGGAILDATINCVFLPRNTNGAVSTIVSAIPFMGVDYALGE